VLNATDLANLLAAGDVKVASGGTAKDIEVSASLSWVSTSRLTLDAFHSIAFNKPVTVAGTGAPTIITNDGGSGGDFQFFGKGHVEFWDLSSNLVINGSAYRLVDSIQSLARGVRQNNVGSYALAKHVNSLKQYLGAPVGTFGGTFEGLGNTISNLKISDATDQSDVGLFKSLIQNGGSISTVRDLGLLGVAVQGTGTGQFIGALAGANGGNILNCYVTGQVLGSGGGSNVGGLVGAQGGSIGESYSSATVTAADNSIVGGLAGLNVEFPGLYVGVIEQTFADGSVLGGDGTVAGGLIGSNMAGAISNSYAMDAVTGGANSSIGGLIGSNSSNNGSNPSLTNSYSTGAASGGFGATVGGLIGEDLAEAGTSDTYWDLDTSGIGDPSRGAGNIANDPGITGLSDAQLKSGLPAGFDPAIWGRNAGINNGYPYLLANPPP
jgi:hypothetical protein